MTDLNTAGTGSYTSRVSGYTDYVEFTSADYSYNYLTTTAKNLATSMSTSNGVDVVSYYVSDKENKIVIGCSEDTYSTAAGMFRARTTIPVEIVEDTPSTPTATTLKSGFSLYNADRGTEFTLGACGTYGTQTVFVTCGHTYQQVGDEIELRSTFQPIGTVLYHRYADYLYGDFEIVSINTSSFTPSNDIVAGGYSITDYISNPSVGTVLRFYGKETAAVGYGTVSATGLTIDSKNNASGTDITTVYGLTRLVIASGSVDDGDSGGPVFQGATSNAKLGGIISGRSTDNPYMYFTPYTYFYAAGFRVQTS